VHKPPQTEENSVRPKTVSILLTNYNHAKYLPDSLEGICGQLRPADEIIIVDDGSTDNSVEIIKSVQKKFSRIQLLENGDNKGVQYSIRRALNSAKMDFIVWAAADDLLLPNFLAENMSMLEKNENAKISFSRLATFKDGSTDINSFDETTNGLAFDFSALPHFLEPAQLQDRLKASYLWLSGNTAVVERLALKEFDGFLPELKWHSDWFSFYAVALRNGTCLIPETLAAMRVLPETYSSAGIQNAKEQRTVLTEVCNALAYPHMGDVRKTFRARPCLFSPMGSRMLPALRQNVRDLDLYIRYLTWHLNHEGVIMLSQAANPVPHRTAKRFIGKFFVTSSRLLNWFTPAGWKNPV